VDALRKLREALVAYNQTTRNDPDETE
jgi:hypothetical protein